VAIFPPIPGETPIDDISELKIKGIRFSRELNLVEAKNILEAAQKYFSGKPTARMAPFDYAWALRLHREMFGKVWDWAGRIRMKPGVNIGVPRAVRCLPRGLASGIMAPSGTAGVATQTGPPFVKLRSPG
jgi:fido (protein-threonine AMPylation protein)